MYDRTHTCGLTAAGDVYCVAYGGTIDARTYALVPLDLGVKLRSIAGQCGFGVDGKAYCWNYRTFKAQLVPGQL